jgi:hypothetical protein
MLASRLKAPVTIAPPDRILIEMSEDEARTLMEILQHVGGPPAGRRAHADRLIAALEKVNVERAGAHTTTDGGTIYFRG